MSTSVRQALSVQPINVANLIHVLSHHLFTLLPSSLFPTSSATFTSGQDPTKEALNCLRVLGRVLVVVYEAEAGGTEVEGEEKSFAQKWLWSRQPVEPRTESNGNGDGEVPTAGEEESQFTIADEEEEEEIEGDGVDGEAQAFKAVVGHPPETNGDRSSPTANGEQIADPLSRPLPPKGDDEEEREEEDMIPCLIDRLFSCTIDLLFCAGFTVPDSVRGQDGPGEKINVRITVSVGSAGELDRNKTEVLRACKTHEPCVQTQSYQVFSSYCYLQQSTPRLTPFTPLRTSPSSTSPTPSNAA